MAPEACLTGHPCSRGMNCWMVTETYSKSYIVLHAFFPLHRTTLPYFETDKQLLFEKPVKIFINQSNKFRHQQR